MTMAFHHTIRDAVAAMLREEPLTLQTIVDRLKAHENGTVRLVVSSTNPTQRIAQILALDPEKRFRQRREIVAPRDRHWELNDPR